MPRQGRRRRIEGRALSRLQTATPRQQVEAKLALVKRSRALILLGVAERGRGFAQTSQSAAAYGLLAGGVISGLSTSRCAALPASRDRQLAPRQRPRRDHESARGQVPLRAEAARSGRGAGVALHLGLRDSRQMIDRPRLRGPAGSLIGNRSVFARKQALHARDTHAVDDACADCHPKRFLALIISATAAGTISSQEGSPLLIRPSTSGVRIDR